MAKWSHAATPAVSPPNWLLVVHSNVTDLLERPMSTVAGTTYAYTQPIRRQVHVRRSRTAPPPGLRVRETRTFERGLQMHDDVKVVTPVARTNSGEATLVRRSTAGVAREGRLALVPTSRGQDLPCHNGEEVLAELGRSGSGGGGTEEGVRRAQNEDTTARRERASPTLKHAAGKYRAGATVKVSYVASISETKLSHSFYRPGITERDYDKSA
ncbi:hypothetical protein V8E53_004600 [Lactarius tabidus]